MTRVDFYVLDRESPDEVRRTACRITEEAWLAGHRVYLLAPSAGDAARMDGLLWTWRQDSFVPHALADAPPAAGGDRPPVVVGHAEPGALDCDVLVSLWQQAPPFFARFERVAEFVDASATSRSAGRERFRFYRDRGCEMHSNDI